MLLPGKECLAELQSLRVYAVKGRQRVLSTNARVYRYQTNSRLNSSSHTRPTFSSESCLKVHILWCSHTLSQLSLSLTGLQLQPLNSKSQSFLLLSELFHLHYIQACQIGLAISTRVTTRRLAKAFGASATSRSCRGARIKSPLLEIMLGNQRLFATL